MKLYGIAVIALTACGSKESSKEGAKDPPAKPLDAAVVRKDLGVTPEVLGCGKERAGAVPVLIGCDAPAGKVVRVTLSTVTSDNDAERAIRDAVPWVLDAISPDMPSEHSVIAVNSLPGSKSAEYLVDGLAFRYEKTDAGLKYWVEPAP